MRILIDGDACPVIESVVRLTSGTGILVYLFRSYDHYSLHIYPDHVRTKYIDGGRDAVDFTLIQYVTSQDIVITQDYGLASLILNRAQYVMHHNGRRYTQDNIEQLLAQRYHNQQKRRKTKRYGKGPKAFDDSQRRHFEAQFLKLIHAN
ncbi:YaiI/YqxD family protein [Staphylococcus felis]|uniref:UPF0178 protein DOS76_07140 n=1 Tax=Staphylococcus felis TaxID=46127 RepID=A0AAQ0KPL7_9STAP|nr:YaiI/YqxD family protein [Staphylococcus felis]AVP35671.1 YaiI/YqxD family protein [Staphylococcus felis]MBH9580786.1 YaiI/YqxD family protein [Staphylococcus felis]MDM8327028.1 YaiI/YqxD family protein [Staphylococcus felis]MDQ7192537.1 YaiI/YqxD family protein [Staphylococcus felis]PNZ38006.1 YaiI/YqxD family protein [Staphylococcus felis]